MISKKCVNCGIEFPARRRTQQCCSRVCAQQLPRPNARGCRVPRISKPCEYCGKQFGENQRPSITKNQRFCSMRCRSDKDRELAADPAEIERRRAQRKASRAAAARGEGKLNDLGKMIKNCEFCGEEFGHDRIPSRVALMKFCSVDCQKSSAAGETSEGKVDWSWAARGACVGSDPMLFALLSHAECQFGTRHPRIQEALSFCEGCPVRAECLAYAEKDRACDGVWGGRYFPEKRKRKRKKERETCTSGHDWQTNKRVFPSGAVRCGICVDARKVAA